MLAATHSRPVKVPKPQSVEAITRSRSPTTATASSMRRATTSRVLDEVGGGVDHAGDQQPVLGQGIGAQRRVLVLVAGVGELDGERAGVRLVEDRQDGREPDVVDVRALPVAPAAVQPHAIARDALERPC